tara:strand:- start:1961 stop:2170 length:210 start_codon:yes stop_codon:yes gene_type:complete
VKTYYRLKNKLVDAEKHLNGVPEMFTEKSVVFILNNYRGVRYIPINKIVLECDLTEKDKKLLENYNKKG